LIILKFHYLQKCHLKNTIFDSLRFLKNISFTFEGCASTIGGGGDRGKASADKGTGTEDLGFFVHRNVESERFRSTESLYSNVYGTNGGPKANFQTR
jgi:hypothetical protein